MYVTHKEAYSVACPKCGEEPGSKCRDTRYAVTHLYVPALKRPHQERISRFSEFSRKERPDPGVSKPSK